MAMVDLPLHRHVCRDVNLHNISPSLPPWPQGTALGGEESWLGDTSHKGLGSTTALWKLL